MPDPLLRCFVLSRFGDLLFIFRGHRHAIVRRIRRCLSLSSAFCQFLGIYLIVNHDALLSDTDRHELMPVRMRKVRSGRPDRFTMRSMLSKSKLNRDVGKGTVDDIAYSLIRL